MLRRLLILLALLLLPSLVQARGIEPVLMEAHVPPDEPAGGLVPGPGQHLVLLDRSLARELSTPVRDSAPETAE